MTIIEQFQQGKHPNPNLCEDALVVTRHYAAVIDGSTSKGSHDYGVKSGRLASQLLIKEIESWQTDMSAHEACKRLTAVISNYYTTHSITEEVKNKPENRLTASVVIYNPLRDEVWQIGDCPFLSDGILHDNPKSVDELMAQTRSLVLTLQTLEGKSVSDIANHDEGRETILPLLRRQCMLQNNPKAGELAYGVIDGFEVAKEHVVITKVAQATEIVLASDGYPHLLPTLKESEEALKKVLRDDPMCFHEFKATKGLAQGQLSFDDRTYIRIKKV